MGAQPWDEQRRVCSSRALPDAFQPTVLAGARQQRAHGVALICRKGCIIRALFTLFQLIDLRISVPTPSAAHRCMSKGINILQGVRWGEVLFITFFESPLGLRIIAKKKKKKRRVFYHTDISVLIKDSWLTHRRNKDWCIRGGDAQDFHSLYFKVFLCSIL